MSQGLLADNVDTSLASLQHINGQHPAKQVCKIWRKNFQALPSYHILGFGSFFSRTLYYIVVQQMRCSVNCTISERAEKDVSS